MAVTLGGPFMAMRCQPAVICSAPPLPNDLTIFAMDSGVLSISLEYPLINPYYNHRLVTK